MLRVGKVVWCKLLVVFSLVYDWFNNNIYVIFFKLSKYKIKEIVYLINEGNGKKSF